VIRSGLILSAQTGLNYKLNFRELTTVSLKDILANASNRLVLMVDHQKQIGREKFNTLLIYILHCGQVSSQTKTEN
jgi:hypothetical protein